MASSMRQYWVSPSFYSILQVLLKAERVWCLGVHLFEGVETKRLEE